LTPSRAPRVARRSTFPSSRAPTSYNGVAFERNQNNNMTAVNYILAHQPAHQEYLQPIRLRSWRAIWIPKIVHGKNKLFFFVDYQGTKRRQYAASTNLTLPTAAMRHGRPQCHRCNHLRSAYPEMRTARAEPISPTTRFPRHASIRHPATLIWAAARVNPIERLHEQLRCLRQHPVQPEQLGFQGQLQSHRQGDGVGAGTVSLPWISWPCWFWDPRGVTRLAAATRAMPADAFRPPRPASPMHSRPRFLVDGNVGYTRQNIGANGDPEDGLYGLNVLKIPGTNGVGTKLFRNTRIPGHGRRKHWQYEHGQSVPIPRQSVHKKPGST
jgi:hypothetical protein